MPYEFDGFFARPPLPRPTTLPPDAVWQEITIPFVGVGLRLPDLIDLDEKISPADIQALAQRFGIARAARWIYLSYACYGAEVEYVYGFGFRDGTSFGPLEAWEGREIGQAIPTYLSLMEQFGVSAAQAMHFEPFVRDFWGDY